MSFTLAADGERLATYAWEPAGDPRGLVFLMHGYAEHAGRYAALAGALSDAGFSVHAIDHRGHGRSGGGRGLVARPETVANDFGVFADAVLDARPGLPAALFGHSMGGAAAVPVALRLQDRLGALVLSSPFIDPVPAATPFTKALVGLLARLVPGMPLDRLDTIGLSHEAAEVEAYERDPLVHHGPVVAATASALIRAGVEAVRRAPELRLPLLVFHGEHDPIAGLSGTRRLFQAAGTGDRQLRVFGDSLHEILNDEGRETMITELRDWLVDRLAARQDG